MSFLPNLDLTHSGLTSLPDTIGQLQALASNLTEFSAQFPHLADIPAVRSAINAMPPKNNDIITHTVALLKLVEAPTEEDTISLLNLVSSVRKVKRELVIRCTTALRADVHATTGEEIARLARFVNSIRALDYRNPEVVATALKKFFAQELIPDQTSDVLECATTLFRHEIDLSEDQDRISPLLAKIQEIPQEQRQDVIRQVCDALPKKFLSSTNAPSQAEHVGHVLDVVKSIPQSDRSVVIAQTMEILASMSTGTLLCPMLTFVSKSSQEQRNLVTHAARECEDFLDAAFSFPEEQLVDALIAMTSFLPEPLLMPRILKFMKFMPSDLWKEWILCAKTSEGTDAELMSTFLNSAHFPDRVQRIHAYLQERLSEQRSWVYDLAEEIIEHDDLLKLDGESLVLQIAIKYLTYMALECSTYLCENLTDEQKEKFIDLVIFIFTPHVGVSRTLTLYNFVDTVANLHQTEEEAENLLAAASSALAKMPLDKICDATLKICHLMEYLPPELRPEWAAFIAEHPGEEISLVPYFAQYPGRKQQVRDALQERWTSPSGKQLAEKVLDDMRSLDLHADDPLIHSALQKYLPNFLPADAGEKGKGIIDLVISIVARPGRTIHISLVQGLMDAIARFASMDERLDVLKATSSLLATLSLKRLLTKFRAICSLKPLIPLAVLQPWVSFLKEHPGEEISLAPFLATHPNAEPPLHEYIQQQLRTPDQREARQVSDLLLRHMSAFRLHVEHPLIQEAMSLQATAAMHTLKNPYRLYKYLQERANEPTPNLTLPSERIGGETVGIRVEGFEALPKMVPIVTFGELPQVKGPKVHFHAFLARLNALGQRAPLWSAMATRRHDKKRKEDLYKYALNQSAVSAVKDAASNITQRFPLADFFPVSKVFLS